MSRLDLAGQAVFARAVTRRSHGCVSAPRSALGVHEAKALWRAVCAAFPVSADTAASRTLTKFERVGLVRALAGRGNRLRLPEGGISAAQGAALWDLARSLAQLTGRTERRASLSRRAGIAALVIGASQLAACATILGGNVKGSFSCSAPDGTCAPSSVIDDRALAMISGTAPTVQPAGPYTPEAVAIGNRVAVNGSVSRTGQKVLKIVFPAHVDVQGRFHEQSAIRTVVDNGVWLADARSAEASLAAVAYRLPAQGQAETSGEVDLASVIDAAPRPEEVMAARQRASLVPVVAAVAAPVAGASSQPAIAPPGAVPPAPALGRDAIRAQIDQLLAKGVIPATPAPAPGSASSATPALRLPPVAAAPLAAGVAPPAALAAQGASPAPVNRPASFSPVVED